MAIGYLVVEIEPKLGGRGNTAIELPGFLHTERAPLVGFHRWKQYVLSHSNASLCVCDRGTQGCSFAASFAQGWYIWQFGTFRPYAVRLGWSISWC